MLSVAKLEKYLTSARGSAKMSMMTEKKNDTNKSAIKIAVAAGAVLLVMMVYRKEDNVLDPEVALEEAQELGEA